MAKSQKLSQLENEVSAMGYKLVRRYAILDGNGHTVETFSSLDAIDEWTGHLESLQMGNAGGDCP